MWVVLEKGPLNGCVRVQLPTYADNVALPALACHTPLLQQSPSARRAHSSKLAAPDLPVREREFICSKKNTHGITKQ